MQSVEEIRILVVDDEPNILELLEMGLSNEGFKVQVAPDGMMAVEISKQFQPHLVILDIMMPGMDGFEVCSILKKNGEVAILMLTAKDEVNVQMKGFMVGADDYLAKPFSFEELLRRIYERLHAQFPYLMGEVG